MYDPETGLYYNRARYYDPTIGRFMNEDTYEGQIDNPLTLNLYTYVGNNPLRYTDPTGHEAVDPLLFNYNVKINQEKINWAIANEKNDAAGKKAAEKEANRLRAEFNSLTVNNTELRNGLLQSTSKAMLQYTVTNTDTTKATVILVGQSGTVYYEADPTYSYWEQVHTITKAEEIHTIASKAIIGFTIGTVATFGTTAVVMYGSGGAAAIGLELLPSRSSAGATKTMIYRTNIETGKIDNMIIDTYGAFVTGARYWRKY